jgi:saccharopine dehydrogenase (NAD+, L-lysine-forming)
MKYILRDEARQTERRTPVTPAHAAEIVKAGIELVVETSTKRVFPDTDYKAAGCQIIAAGSWLTANKSDVILGLKELPCEPDNLPNAMIHFAHVYKDQTGWQNELKRFGRGGGTLYDLEYLVGADGRRVAAFGYWAGWMGAALAVWKILADDSGSGGPDLPLRSFDDRQAVVDIMKGLAAKSDRPLTAVVIGANGRSGTGAADALEIAGVTVTRWDMAETANLDREALLSHDILVNCVLMTGPGLLLATPQHLKSPQGKLRMISDVSCDPFSDFNPLPIYDAPTSWAAPYVSLGKNGQGEEIQLTAIDNLPSLIPLESSQDFSEQLLPTLKCFGTGVEWQAAKKVFEEKLAQARKN